jgi:hypothetical protein
MNQSVFWAQPVTFGQPHLVANAANLLEVMESTMPRLMTDRTWIAFSEVYLNVSLSTIRKVEGEIHPRNATVVIAGAQVPGAQLRITKADSSYKQIRDYQQPVITTTALGNNNPADCVEYYSVSKDTGIATRIPSPVIGFVMNKWKSSYIGSIVTFDGSGIVQDLTYATTDPASATCYSWDLDMNTSYGWDVNTDSVVQSGAPYSVAYALAPIATKGFLHPTMTPKNLSIKRAKIAVETAESLLAKTD